MQDYYTDETAYTLDNLESLLSANTAVPDWFVDVDILERVVTVAQQRAQSRGEQSALENGQSECLLITDWYNFARGEWGADTDDSVNQATLGILDARASADRNAILFTDSVVLQTGWLQSGDGRRTKVKHYIDEDYADAERGAMWIPKSVTDYIAIIGLSAELIHDQPTVEEAM